MSVQSVLQEWYRKSRMISTASLLLVVLLLSSGCGTRVGNPATTPPGGNGQQTANLSTENGLSPGSSVNGAGNSVPNTVPAPSANNPSTDNSDTSTTPTNQSAAGTSQGVANNSTTNTANGSSNSSIHAGETGHADTQAGVPLQLENIQIGDKSVLFTTTHGNMHLVFVNPHIENGSPNRFVVTLVHVNPGKYAVNKTTRLQTHWATSMTIVQQGKDLEVQFDLLPSIQRFTSAMGAGQMMLYTFQSS